MGDIHAIFVPIGGGGLATGVAAYVKAIRPDSQIIGVEASDSASMYHSLKTGRRIILDQVGSSPTVSPWPRLEKKLSVSHVN